MVTGFSIFSPFTTHSRSKKIMSLAARDKYDSTTALLTQTHVMTHVVQKKPTPPNFTTLLQTLNFSSGGGNGTGAKPRRISSGKLSDEACRHAPHVQPASEPCKAGAEQPADNTKFRHHFDLTRVYCK
jgi:hypothetical protein